MQTVRDLGGEGQLGQGNSLIPHRFHKRFKLAEELTGWKNILQDYSVRCNPA